MTVVSPAVLADLAPTGKLRAGINFSNFLLTAREPDGTPRGVALDLAHELLQVRAFDPVGGRGPEGQGRFVHGI